MSQILQVDVSGTPQNIAEPTQADSTKYGARTVDVDARTKLEAIRALLAAGISVSIGDVNLSAASLSALENVVVSGTVGLDSASLAALESVTVSGTVALDAATLSALETITVGGTVGISGAVALDATTLAALETISVGNFPASQSVDVASDTTQNPLAKYRIADLNSGTTAYYGFTSTSGKWVILKEDKSANPNTYRYANGASDYPTNWTGRAGLTYQYLHQLTGL